MFKLDVKNFQSIESSILEIDQLTVITGTNSAGKSALVRAFAGVFLNSPAKALVRKGCEDLEVKISFAEDSYVLWKKGKNHNDYIINGDSKENVNRGAPEGIESLGVLPVDVTGSQKKRFWPQIAQQHDPVSFVLSEQGHTIAEVVVSDVEKVTHLNQALFLTEKQRREAKSKEKIRLNDLEKIRQEKKKYSPIRVISQEFSDYEKRVKALSENLWRYENLKSLYSSYDETERVLKSLNSILDLSVPNLTDLTKSKSLLTNLVFISKNLEKRNKELEGLKSISNISVPDIRVDLKKLKELHDIYKNIKTNRERLEEVSLQIRNTSAQIEENEKQIDYQLNELGICPMCRKETKDD